MMQCQRRSANRYQKEVEIAVFEDAVKTQDNNGEHTWEYVDRGTAWYYLKQILIHERDMIEQQKIDVRFVGI